MFTGIIETTGTVREVTREGSNIDFWIDTSITNELKIDQSVAHNGVCLTVVEIAGDAYRVTAVAETLAKTSLAHWQSGDVVNIERSLRVGDRLDGHFVQGHVDASAECIEKEILEGSWLFRFKFPKEYAALVIEKGSICINGVSLTVFDVRKHKFTVTIIPYTYQHTNFHSIGPGTVVNIEFDVLGKYLLRREKPAGLSLIYYYFASQLQYMRIAFDAKRAFQNTTGLGHYSRTLITSLTEGYPQHTYLLMAPKQTELYKPQAPNVEVVTPAGLSKTFSSLWRSNWVKKDLKRLHADLYHGLSHEIPVGIEHTGIPSVVTIHDLVFERYPEQYKSVDVAIYRRKFRYACQHADMVIAISGQTKEDIVHFYDTPADKIRVCYQACNPIYSKIQSSGERNAVIEKYKLPLQYFLYVGSIIERKNLLTICRAIAALKGRLDVPLVVIGNGDSTYTNKVKSFVAANNLQDSILFLSDDETIKNDPCFKSSADFPAIYQSALAMIYPSVYEGFGLPVLEALWSRTPVITSNLSCLPETGGDAAYYIDPLSVEQMTEAMQAIAHDASLRQTMADKGIAHAQQNFTTQKCAEKVMDVYETVMSS